MIVGGDFNVVTSVSLDTSRSIPIVSKAKVRRVQKLLHREQMIDVWRLQHPTEREYTFYSNPHKSYSRIDLFLVPHAQLQAVEETEIDSITWSDHAMIVMIYRLTKVRSIRQQFWKLNESLLQKEEIVAEVTREMKSYFEINAVDYWQNRCRHRKEDPTSHKL